MFAFIMKMYIAPTMIRSPARISINGMEWISIPMHHAIVVNVNMSISIVLYLSKNFGSDLVVDNTFIIQICLFIRKLMTN